MSGSYNYGGSGGWGSPQPSPSFNDQETLMADEAQMKDYWKNKLSTEEMEADLARYFTIIERSQGSPRGSINGNDALRKRAEKVFGMVQKEIVAPDGYDLARCIDTLRFENLDFLAPPGSIAQGVTQTGGMPGYYSEPMIAINRRLQSDAMMTDSTLAHEGTHARLYTRENNVDDSEWLEQLVAMEASLRFSKESPEKKGAFEGEIADHLAQGATMALVQKLKRDGKSYDEIGSYLMKRFNLPFDYVDNFVLWSRDSQYARMAKQQALEQLTVYEFVPYVGQKFVQNGGDIKYSYRQKPYSVHLDSLKEWKPAGRTPAPYGPRAGDSYGFGGPMRMMMLTDALCKEEGPLVDAGFMKYHAPPKLNATKQSSSYRAGCCKR